MATYTRQSLYKNPQNAKQEVKDLQVVGLINMLYGKEAFYKKILYHNERILPSESRAFENYIETKKMQKDFVSYLLKGYFLYSFVSHRRNWFKLTSRMNNNIFMGCLIFYVKLIVLYAKNAEEIRYVNKNMQIIKNSVLENMDMISQISLQRKRQFYKLMDVKDEMGKYQEMNMEENQRNN